MEGSTALQLAELKVNTDHIQHQQIMYNNHSNHGSGGRTLTPITYLPESPAFMELHTPQGVTYDIHVTSHEHQGSMMTSPTAHVTSPIMTSHTDHVTSPSHMTRLDSHVSPSTPLSTTECEYIFKYSDSMDSNNMSVDSPMGGMAMQQRDIKPDLTQLGVATGPGGFGGQGQGFNASQGQVFNPVGTSQPDQRYSAPSTTQPGYFGMGQGMPSHPDMAGPLQSPTLHSPSSGMMASPGSMTSPMQSPGGNLTPLQSPTSTMSMSSPAGNMGMPMSLQGPTHAHSSLSTKHICAICGDRASGKHYGVYSCEGCKGFFKRTVRKDLQYACRDERNCIIDKRQRNRCQYCRYMKCLAMGMKREAVQEERQRVKEKGEGEVESTSSANSEMPVERVLEAELAVEPSTDTYVDAQKDPVTNICQAADKQLFTLVEWAKRIPHFPELPLEDQVILLRAGWNELLIAGFSHRSTAVKDGILLATGLHIHRTSAHQAGVGTIFDRVLTELVAKMREMKMDKTELGCLRSIVLFNPDAKNLQATQEVETLREKVYASLEEYCKTQYPDEPGRFAKLLLRLPALRSIGLKCMEHLFFFKLIGDTPIDTFLMEMLEAPSPTS